MRGDDLLARIGGDQFALLVDGADTAAAEATARRVLDAVAAPYNLDGAQFTLTCSIGGALCPGNGHSADELVRHAEAAVLAVKDGGRANYRVHKGGAAATAAPTSSSTTRCARRWPAGASACTTSRRWTCAAAAWSAPRR